MAAYNQPATRPRTNVAKIKQAHMDVSTDSFSKTTPFLGWLAVGGRALEEWYDPDFERRVTEITGVLRNQIRGNLRSQFTTELNAAAERTLRQFEERAYRQWPGAMSVCDSVSSRRDRTSRLSCILRSKLLLRRRSCRRNSESLKFG
jgi:hypothetical protein